MWRLSGAATPVVDGQNRRGFDKRDIAWHMRWPPSSSWANNTPFVGFYLPVWVRVNELHTLRRALHGVLLLPLGRISTLEEVLHVFADIVFVRLHRNRNVWFCV